MSTSAKSKLIPIVSLVVFIVGLGLVLKSPFNKSSSPPNIKTGGSETVAPPRPISTTAGSAKAEKPFQVANTSTAQFGAEKSDPMQAQSTTIAPNKMVAAVQKRHEEFVNTKVKEMLASEDKARVMLKEVEKCIVMLKSGGLSIPSFAGAGGDAEKTAIYRRQRDACVDIGKQTVEAYPSLKNEFEQKILKPAQDI